MRVIAVVMLVVMFLSGCSKTSDLETVSDVYDLPASVEKWEVTLALPEGASQAAMESGSGGRLYLCDGFSVSVSTLNGGDVQRSIREFTGFEKSALTVMQTEQSGIRRYAFAWCSLGEGTEQICRAVMLDDGNNHHSVTVMCDYEMAGTLDQQMDAVLESVKLINSNID